MIRTVLRWLAQSRELQKGRERLAREEIEQEKAVLRAHVLGLVGETQVLRRQLEISEQRAQAAEECAEELRIERAQVLEALPGRDGTAPERARQVVQELRSVRLALESAGRDVKAAAEERDRLVRDLRELQAAAGSMGHLVSVGSARRPR